MIEDVRQQIYFLDGIVRISHRKLIFLSVKTVLRDVHAFFIRKLVMLLVLDFLKNFSKF